MNYKDRDLYFTLGQSWASDMYARLQQSIRQMRLAVIYLSGLSILLIIALLMVLPLQHTVPLLVNHYQDGTVAISTIRKPYKPSTQAEVESDLVRYIINRESYSYADFDMQYRLVNLLSSSKVASDYRKSQQGDAAQAMTRLYSNKQYLTVHVTNISFIDNAQLNDKQQHNHRNLAQVDFVVTKHDVRTGEIKNIPYRSIVSWQYTGMPTSPFAQWHNWAGFAVNYYQRAQRQVEG